MIRIGGQDGKSSGNGDRSRRGSHFEGLRGAVAVARAVGLQLGACEIRPFRRAEEEGDSGRWKQVGRQACHRYI